MKKRVLIYGLGITGKELIKFCKKNKIPFYDHDDNKKNNFDKVLNKISEIILSPGIARSNKNINKALKLKIPVISEIEYASRYIEKPIISITGTNGKTTTTMITYKLLKKSKNKIFIGGNIGKPLISSLNNNKQYDLYLLETSSFQLQFVKNNFNPLISLITNLSPNHLDHHKNLKEYYNSKLNNFKNQDYKSYSIIGSNIERNIVKKIKNKKTNLIISKLIQDEKNIYFDKFKIKKERLKLVGNHNYENIVNSLNIVKIISNISKNHIEELYKFNPPEFRLEKITDYPKIFNDSKSTSVDSLRNALQSFNIKIRLIIGGKNKNLNYENINELIKKSTSKVYIFGENKFILAKTLVGNNIVICKDLEDATRASLKNIKKDETLLFSPGSSSFDSYSSYIERGVKFNKYVKKFLR